MIWQYCYNVHWCEIYNDIYIVTVSQRDSWESFQCFNCLDHIAMEESLVHVVRESIDFNFTRCWEKEKKRESSQLGFLECESVEHGLGIREIHCRGCLRYKSHLSWNHRSPLRTPLAIFPYIIVYCISYLMVLIVICMHIWKCSINDQDFGFSFFQDWFA